MAPRRTSVVLWLAVLPTRTWDWAMRTAAALDARTLGRPGHPAPAPAAPAPTTAVASPGAPAPAPAN